MSNFFNIKRAANFLVYDLNSAKNNFLLSLVICVLMPAICFAFAMVFSLLLNQSPAEVAEPLQFMAIFVGTIIAVVNFPTKQYGGLTDKRYGSDWLMLPASSFEKWLSMVIVSCIVFPICLFGLMLLCDWLLSVIFPALYPKAIVASDLISTLTRIGGDTPSELESIMPHFNLGLEVFVDFSQTVLFFVLGAVFFKQSKFAKSLLVLFAFSAVLSFVFIAIFGNTSLSENAIVALVDEGNFPEFLDKALRIGRILNAVIIILIGGGLYCRIKSLKH